MQVKFYAKNVDGQRFADFAYIGSMQCESTLRENLIRSAESIGGKIYGPILCTIEGEQDIKVLRI